MLKSEKTILSLLFSRPLLVKDFDREFLHSAEAFYIFDKLKENVKEKNLKTSVNSITASLWFEEQTYKLIVKDIFSLNLNLFTYNLEVLNDIIYELEKEKIKEKNKSILKELYNAIESNDNIKAEEYVASLVLHRVESVKNTNETITDTLSNITLFKSGTRLDNYVGLPRTKSMIGIAGMPGTMKTYFSMYYIINILKQNKDFTALYFEKEMPKDDIALRLTAYFMQKDIEFLNHYLFNKKSDELVKMYKDVVKSNDEYKSLLERFIMLDSGDFSNVVDINKYIKRYKAKIWCLDYIQQMCEYDINSEMNKIPTYLKDITKENDAFGIVLSQVNDKEIARRENKIPLETDMQYGTRLQQNIVQQISLFYPYKQFKGQQPMTTNKYEPNFFFCVINKARDAKEPKNVVPFFTAIDDGFFKEVTKVEDLSRMENWYLNYVSKTNEKPKFKGN